MVQERRGQASPAATRRREAGTWDGGGRCPELGRNSPGLDMVRLALAADRARDRPARWLPIHLGDPLAGPRDHPIRPDGDLDRAREVGPEHAASVVRQAGECRRGRMSVRIARTNGDHRQRGSEGVEQGIGGRRRAAVMCDLQEVDVRQPASDELGIDRLLGIPRQEDPPTVDLAEQDDRDVVDADA
jgi:hypothetical protein